MACDPASQGSLHQRGRTVREVLTASLACLVVLNATPAISAPACTAPTAWPLGHHVGEVAMSGNRIVATQGWDPAFFPDKGHQPLKDALTDGIGTYRVGLPGLARTEGPEAVGRAAASGATPASRGGHAEGVDDTAMAAGRRTMSISSPATTCRTARCISRRASRSRSGDRPSRISARTLRRSGVWIVDSLIDVRTARRRERSAAARRITCKTHVMYSEQMGGLDVGKAHNMTYYRNHLHGSMKVDDGHADGLQINASSDCAFIFENNVEFLFRMTNRALFLQNSNPGGIHNTWIVNNVISGGANCINLCEKEVGQRSPLWPVHQHDRVRKSLPRRRRQRQLGKSDAGHERGCSRADLRRQHFRDITTEKSNGFISGDDGNAHTVRDSEGDTAELLEHRGCAGAVQERHREARRLMETWSQRSAPRRAAPRAEAIRRRRPRRRRRDAPAAPTLLPPS